ncbi:MAG: hypothetical protein ACRD3W_24540, partial [Terriglobales bacterium]
RWTPAQFCPGRHIAIGGSPPIGLSSRAYPYFPVVCDYCQRHPSRWVRRVSPGEAGELRERGEASRLALDRRLGWDAVPSNNFTAHSDAQGVVLEGSGEGHGIGLCQAGARAMAQTGAAFREILEHYYPNTVLMNRSAQSDASAWREPSPSRDDNRAVVR